MKKKPGLFMPTKKVIVSIQFIKIQIKIYSFYFLSSKS